MAKGKPASHNRASRVVTTTGHAVGGKKVVHQAPAGFPANTIPGANNIKPAPVVRGMNAGHRNSPGDTI